VAWKPDYVTSAVLKSYLRIDDGADDAFVALWITAVSRNVDDFAGRQFGQVAAPEARVYTPVWDRHRCQHVVDVDDLPTLTGLQIVDEDATTITGQTYEPVNALAEGRPYERLLLGSAATSHSGDLTITASWGWSAVPSAVQLGVLLQGARLAARRDSPFGVAGSPSEGSELRLLAQLDPDFKTTLRPYVRKWWAR
jgi:hypothetical protein